MEREIKIYKVKTLSRWAHVSGQMCSYPVGSYVKLSNITSPFLAEPSDEKEAIAFKKAYASQKYKTHTYKDYKLREVKRLAALLPEEKKKDTSPVASDG